MELNMKEQIQESSGQLDFFDPKKGQPKKGLFEEHPPELRDQLKKIREDGIKRAKEEDEAKAKRAAQSEESPYNNLRVGPPAILRKKIEPEELENHKL